MCGNTSDLCDIGESPGKSSLFFLTVPNHQRDPGIGLPRERVIGLEKAPNMLGVRCAVDNP